jgi:hypothetical protein
MPPGRRAVILWDDASWWCIKPCDFRQKKRLSNRLYFLSFESMAPCGARDERISPHLSQVNKQKTTKHIGGTDEV